MSHSRELAYQKRLAKTLGAFFTKTWIDERGDDGLVNFCIDEDESVCMEFVRSSFIEFHWRDMPQPIALHNTDPASAWKRVLEACEGEEMRAIATVLFQANEDMADQTTYLHVDSGAETFLNALGLQDS